MGTERCDVVVIGAGLSGLCAARRVAAEGRSVVVLEAQERVGGRVHREDVDVGGVRTGFELGACYVGSNQRALIELCRELGFDMNFDDPASDVVPVRAQGEAIYYLDGKRTLTRPDADLPLAAFNPLSFVALYWMKRRLDRYIEQVKRHLHAPWEASGAEQWDDWSVEDFLKSDPFPTRRDEDMLRIGVRAVLSAEPAEVSFLFFLWYAAAAGGLDTLLDNQGKDAAQGYYFRRGAHAVCARAAAALTLSTHALRLGEAARRIEQDDEGVTVVTATGLTLRARRAVVAMSPFASSRLEYRPALPSDRAQLVQRCPSGRTLKCFAVYDEPFWHDRWSGMSIGNTTPVIWTMDHTVPPGPATMMAFVVADRADALSGRDGAEVERTVCGAMADTFQDDRFLAPRRFLFKDWSHDPWAWGGPVGVPPPGALTAFGRAARRPFGRVHWAGSEASTVWPGYLEGAVNAGHAAADEALAAER